MTTPAVSLPPVHPQAPSPDLAAALAPLAAEFDGTLGETLTDVDLRLPPANLGQAAAALRDRAEFAFDYLRNISGIDFGEEGMALKYQFYSFRQGHTLQVTVPLPPHQHPHASVPSITHLYPAANWHEREAAEMFGIAFDGHPNLKNLLLEEDLHIHPLLKAHPLQKMEVKQGIESGGPGFNQ
jgi:NADH-quinone oxidoreductase subunit C